jgi:hypothetical protein
MATPRTAHARASPNDMAAMRERFVFMNRRYASEVPFRDGAWVGFIVPAAEVNDNPSFEVILAGACQANERD